MKSSEIIEEIQIHIGKIQTLSDKLAEQSEHPDEFVTVNDLQENLHKVRQAFETQINNSK